MAQDHAGQARALNGAITSPPPGPTTGRAGPPAPVTGEEDITAVEGVLTSLSFDGNGRDHYDGLPSLSQLRAFASVAESRSISRGAADLARSQPAVTQAIGNLESSMGAPLFIRQRAGLVLTDAGLILKNRVDRYFAEVRGAVLECGGDRGWSAAQVNALANRLTRSLTTALLLIDEFGSLAHAAKLLGQREATVRKAVSVLEAEMGMRLFDREAHGISTNVHGKVLAARLRLAMRELESAREEVNAGFGIENGRILLGAMMLAGNHLLNSVLQRFTALHPQARVSVMNATSDVLLDGLKRGSIDFAIGLQNRPSMADNVVEEVIADDPFVLAVRRGHPLATRRGLRATDLAQFDWVLARPGAVRRAAFEAIFANRMRPTARVETHSILTILSLLVSSDAIAVMTRSELILEEQLGGRLMALDFGPLDTESRIAVTTRRGWLPTRLQTAFARCLHDHALAG
jgi:LysR family transcriptional regulator, regulator for genes of the gallate degradation pathway